MIPQFEYMNLKGKRALITGAAKGVGREISLSLAGQGVDVAIHYNRSKKEAEELVETIETMGNKAVSFRLDLSKIGKINSFIESVAKALGGLDILINNAAVFSSSELKDVSVKEWEEIFNVNLKAQFFLVQASLPHLERSEPFGHVINISDVHAYSPSARFLPYGVSKAGVIALTKGLAKALAPKVHVNCICPGAIEKADADEREGFQKVIDRTPLRKQGMPQDIADAVLYLLTSDFVTGEELCVDGGRRLI